MTGEPTGNEIAIIGVACRFPGAADADEFWRNLRDGVESISFFDDAELEESHLVPARARKEPGFVPAGGVLADVDSFDHDLFGVSRREARWMDPQQRVFAQLAWAALEDAGYHPGRFPGRIALYAGAAASGHEWALRAAAASDPASAYEALGGAAAENLATKVSFLLGLRGESMNVHTACSTGLTAVHLACQSLLLGQSAIAVAGAARIAVPQRTGYVHAEGMILSPDGHCRAFDHRAAGTVPGNGAGVVVLKPLAEAMAAGDHVYAVIRGSAVNNEGHRSVGYTAPSVAAQAEVVAEALAFAEVSPADIGYVEAHGTGTPLGDPIEVAALTRAFRRGTDRVGDCLIGSVKTNIGHLDTAAGVAGLVKVALMLHHGEIPASLHLERPNPAVDFAASPFTVNTALRPWPAGQAARLAGVSSFGIGGTNVHAVLAEAPAAVPVVPSTRPHQLVTLAAHTASALSIMAGQLADRLSAAPEQLDLADVAYTRAVGRAPLRYRRTCVAADSAELVAALRRDERVEPVAGEPRVVFLFPGQGAASYGMARELYDAEPAFQAALDQCLAAIEPHLGEPLNPVLLSGSGPLTDPAFAHPALFAVEYAMAQLWREWGVEPAALLGNSFGEYAAACVAGVLSLADAAELAVVRGQLVATLPEGAMAAVALDEEGLRPYLDKLTSQSTMDEPASVAVVGGDGRCVVSGTVEAVATLQDWFAADGHATVPLAVRHAFHSSTVEPVLPALAASFTGRASGPPRVPLLSSLTGTWWAGDHGSPRYWARQMREPVRFGAALVEAAGSSTEPTVFLEVGPDQALTALAKAQFRRDPRIRAVPSMRRMGADTSDHRVLVNGLGALWRAGVPVDWDAFYRNEKRRRVPLPTYPFEGVDCRLAPPAVDQGIADVAPEVPVVATRPATPDVPPVEHPVAGNGPRDEVERVVYAIWKERLEVDDFGIDDNFLELGGNSLLAAQALTRLREAFGAPIPLSAMFEAPTVAGLADRIRTLTGSPAKASDAPTSAAELPPIQPVPRGGELPLSVVQARTLALEAVDPGNPALVMPVAVLMEGQLDVAILDRSITDVVRRHESLRTTFHRDSDGQWSQRIGEVPTRPPLVAEDVAGAEPEHATHRIAREEAESGFDLAASPLKVRLLRVAAERHVLLVTMHHVVSDTLSLVAFVQEVAAHYGAYATGQQPAVPPLPVQYADFAAWQRRILTTNAIEPQRAYWRQQLADLPPPLALPADRPRTEGVRGRQLPFGLPKELSTQVTEFSQRFGVTPFVTLLSAYTALLARISGADDVVVGTPVGNRDRTALEPLIGYVAHAVPLRSDLRDRPSFARLVARTQQTMLAAHAHPDLPYEDLVTEVEPGRDTNRSRVFDALFVLHAGLPREQELPGMTWRLWNVPDMPAQFGATLAALSLALGDSADGYVGTLEYAEEQFDVATVRRIQDQFIALLADALKRPEAFVAELSLGGTPALPAVGSSVDIELFLTRWNALVAADPDAVAVAGADAAMTRRELASFAGRVASALHAASSEPAAAWLEYPPSARRLAAVVGVLQAGWPVAVGEAQPPSAWRLGSGVSGDHAIDLDTLAHRTADRTGEASAATTAFLETGVGSTVRAWDQGEVARYLASLDNTLAPLTGVAAVEASLTVRGTLDLLWALASGRLVRVAPVAAVRAVSRSPWLPPAERDPRTLRFSLSYFANDEDSLDGPKYQLLLDGARLADELGLAAVWTPERHFHAFGGLYPSPTATSAALAAVTSRIGIRAGSVVLPLHNPIRTAEDWAVIDNLSGGRVGVSFASGWHPDDFTIAPDAYADRRDVMADGIDVVRRLWRGETVRRRNGAGEDVDIAIRPRPVQPELPFWLTAAGSPATFRLAGEMGAYVLTNLMAQSLDDLADKIAIYRQAWRDAGHPGRGHITLMLHTYLADDAAQAHREVREPLLRYFRSSLDIARGFAVSQGLTVRPEDLSPDDLQALLEHGLERYLHDGGLFGTPDSCMSLVDRVRAVDVDEVAALVDHGVPTDATLHSITLIAELAARESKRATAAAAAEFQEIEHGAAALSRWLDERPDMAVQAPADVLAWVAETNPEVLTDRTLLAIGDRPEAAHLLGARVTVHHGLPDGRWIAARADHQEVPAVRPAPATDVRVVDVHGGDLPVGVVGELLLDSDAAGQRARWRADGRLDLLPPPPIRTTPPPAAPAGAIPPVGRDRALPLSYAQQRLWYLDQLAPGNVAYNNTVALRMDGDLDVGALHRALVEVVRRHEVLRTTFHSTVEGARQVVHPAADLDLPVVDAADESEVDHYARKFARRAFDLARGPLLRCCLLRRHATAHVLLISMHHIVSDGWSAGVLLGELGGLYAAFAAGAPSPLPPLPIQYADYAVWQREQQDTAEIGRDLAYWKDNLADLPLLELPFDHPRRPMQRQRGAREPVHVDRTLTDALTALCQRAGVTPFVALQAAFATLLHRYSGQTDIALGTAVAGRSRPEVEALVGCFINTVVIRTDLSGDPTFRALLARVSQATLGAVSHQELPFERLVDELDAPRDLSHTPLFQAMLVLHNTPQPRVALGGLTLEGRDLDPGTSKTDLTLELREGPDGITGALEYDTDLFEPATVRQLTRHLVRLLASAVAAPDSPVSSLSLLTEDDTARVGALAAGPALSIPAGEPLTDASTVDQAFAAQAALTPDAVAVGDEHQPLTYRELDEAVNQLAHGLRARGVAPGVRVGLLVELTTEAVTAMLAVLKAGGAYVPLDPLAPAGRLDDLVQQAAPALVIASGEESAEIAGVPVLPMVDVAQSQPVTPPAPAAGADDPAYVIFTSGSTGRPKGVVVAHRQLLYSTRARLVHYGLAGRCLCLYPLTFDGSVAWIYFALLTGGTVWQPPRDVVIDPRALGALIANERIDRVAGVPALYAQLLAVAHPDQLASLRSVTVGGEACRPELVHAHARALANTELHNEYGPTEGTVWATVHRVGDPQVSPVPIGRPIPGAHSLVLDPRQQPLPVGAAGELYVGGPGVATGYLGDPALSAEKFVTVDGERYYRTGDRVRWNQRGELEFLGRIDRQVKIRGFRVEPSEIEAVLAAHPAVTEAAVVPVHHGGTTRLAGYLTGAGDDTALADVRQFARSRLPEYLVPAYLVPLAALPRTRSGKLDAAALPPPVPASAAAPTKPRNDLERTLATLVAAVLGVPEVGIDDNFFDVGGDSILAIGLVTRAREHGIELAVRQVFGNPTVARLAAVAGTRLATPAEQGPVTGPVALTPIQRWFFAAEQAEPWHFNMSVLLELAESPQPALLEQAFHAVLRHHDALRLRFTQHGGSWRAHGAPPDSPPDWTLDTVDLSAMDASRHSAEFTARAQELQASLRLAEGPLLRAALVDRGRDAPTRLLVVAHHLVTDGVSWRIVLDDLFTAYRQLTAGAAVTLPPKTTSYREWADRLPEYAASDQAHAEVAYWSSQPFQLAPRLPRDGEASNVEARARMVRLELDADATAALLRDLPSSHHTDVQAVLVGAVARAVSRWTGAEHVQLDIERHGREDLVPGLDVSRTVGWFSDFHPVVLRVPAAATAAERLALVTAHLRAVPHHGAGYVPLRHPAPGTAAAAALPDIPPSEITVNYLGQLDIAAPVAAGVSIVDDQGGGIRAASTVRPYLVEVTAGVLTGRMWFVWSYTEGIHDRATIERLAQDAVAELRELF